MKKIATLLLAFFTCTEVMAFAITLDPFYDSMFGNSNREKNAPNGSDESKWDSSGSYLGARLYATVDIKGQANAYAGIQGGLSEASWVLTEPTSEVDSLEAQNRSARDRWFGKHVGIVLGTQKGAFDTWVGANITTYKNRDNDGSFDKDDILRGTSIEVGVGMRLVSWLKLNLTWRNHKLGTYRDSSTRRSYSLPDEDTNIMGDYDVKETYIGVSMPLTLGSRK